MPRKKYENTRIKTYNKLKELGIANEKDIQKLQIEDLKKITNDEDVQNIILLREHIKNRTTLDYFNDIENKKEGLNRDEYNKLYEILRLNEKDYVGEKGQKAKELQEKIVKFGLVMNKRETDEEEKALISLFPLEIKFIINQLLDFINVYYPSRDYFEELRAETEKRKSEKTEV